MSAVALIRSWTVALCLVVLFAATGAWARSLERVANDVVRSFTRDVPLKEQTVQLAPDSFTELDTRHTLGLSEALYSAFAAALSDAGAKLSVQQVGETPLLVSGEYDIQQKKIVLQVRLRRMGRDASRDLGVRTVHLARSAIAPSLLVRNLKQAAAGLVRQLEAQVVFTRARNYRVVQAVPGGANIPTLKLGKVLQQAVQEAVASAEQFSTVVALGQNVATVALRPQYAVAGRKITLTLILDKTEVTPQYTVHTTLDSNEVGSELLQVYDDRKLKVCATVVAPGRRDIRPGTRRAEEFLQLLKEKMFTGHNVTVGRCVAGFSGRRIDLKLGRDVKKTADGYGFVSSSLRADVVAEKGTLLGVVTSSARISMAVDQRNSSALADKTLDEKCIAELASAVLVYHP